MTWEKVKLGNVCEFVRGLTYSKKDEVELSNNAVLRATNICVNSSKLDLTEIRYISDKAIVKPEKKVRLKDIIICTASGSKSHLGKVAFIDNELDMAFGGFMGAIRAKDSVLPEFLFKVLTSPSFKKQIEGLSDGANINNLKFSQISEFEFMLPPLKEQAEIVEKLNTALFNFDKAIDLATQKIETLNELKQSFLIEALSGKLIKAQL